MRGTGARRFGCRRRVFVDCRLKTEPPSFSSGSPAASEPTYGAQGESRHFLPAYQTAQTPIWDASARPRHWRRTSCAGGELDFVFRRVRVRKTDSTRDQGDSYIPSSEIVPFLRRKRGKRQDGRTRTLAGAKTVTVFGLLCRRFNRRCRLPSSRFEPMKDGYSRSGPAHALVSLQHVNKARLGARATMRW